MKFILVKTEHMNPEQQQPELPIVTEIKETVKLIQKYQRALESHEEALEISKYFADLHLLILACDSLILACEVFSMNGEFTPEEKIKFRRLVMAIDSIQVELQKLVIEHSKGEIKIYPRNN